MGRRWRVMNLDKILHELHARRKAIQHSIAKLEQLQQCAASVDAPTKPRGRKFMGDAERQEVSARMKKYWAAKREQKDDG